MFTSISSFIIWSPGYFNFSRARQKSENFSRLRNRYNKTNKDITRRMRLKVCSELWISGRAFCWMLSEIGRDMIRVSFNYCQHWLTLIIILPRSKICPRLCDNKNQWGERWLGTLPSTFVFSFIGLPHDYGKLTLWLWRRQMAICLLVAICPSVVPPLYCISGIRACSSWLPVEVYDKKTRRDNKNEKYKSNIISCFKPPMLNFLPSKIFSI